MDLGRVPRHTRWTQEFKKLKGKIAADVEKEALQREAEATAKAKTKAEQKAGAEQKSSEQTTEGEIPKPENAEQSSTPK